MAGGTLADTALSEEMADEGLRRTRVRSFARLLEPMRHVTSFLFLASVFCVTFEKVHWNVAGTVSLAGRPGDPLLAFAVTTARLRVPRTTAILVGFFAAFLVVYLAGYFDLSDSDALAQWGKGLTKFVIHFAFLACAVVWLSRRGQQYFWRTLGWFSAGIVVNAAYGVLQLLDARRGGNLDASVISPITGGASQINIYGAINNANVYRPNALTGDPNHLGIMLISAAARPHAAVPAARARPSVASLADAHDRIPARRRGRDAFAQRPPRPRRRRARARGAVPPPSPPSRAAGADRRRAGCTPRDRTLAPSFFTTVLKSRVQTSGGSENAHFQVYDFIPHVLHVDPLFGLGLNTFSVYYEFVTGKSNWGPHSYYVALIVETGLVGALLFGAFVIWVFRRLGTARELGRRLAAAGDPLAARVRPLAWGCTAALAGTLASNAFYLTMQFYYFYAFVALSLAIPVVFAKREP